MKKGINLLFLILIMCKNTAIASDSTNILDSSIKHMSDVSVTDSTSKNFLIGLSIVTGVPIATWFLLKTYGLKNAVESNNIYLVNIILSVKAYNMQDMQEALRVAFLTKNIAMTKILLQNILHDIQTAKHFRFIVEPVLRKAITEKINKSNSKILKMLSESTKEKYITIALDKIFNIDVNKVQLIVDLIQNNNAIIDLILKAYFKA